MNDMFIYLVRLHRCSEMSTNLLKMRVMEMVYEWNAVRVMACLSIVLLHATTNIEIMNGYIEQPYYQFLDYCYVSLHRLLSYYPF